MLIEKVKIEKIKCAEYNPRKDLQETDKKYNEIKNSLSTFGMLEPIIWNKRTGNIIGGHQRFKILKMQGATEIECSVVDFDLEKEKACNIALNNVSGEWDNDKLDQLLFDLQYSDYLMSDFGIDLKDFENVELPEEENPEEEKNEYIIRITFDDYKDFEKIEERLKSLLDEVNVKVMVI